LIRRHRNAIDFLKLSSGTWISDCRLIGNSFCNHFAHLFTASRNSEPPDFLDLFDPMITDDDNVNLCAIPTEQEIYDAFISIGATKASGPDGFIVLFYQTYWTVVKEVVLNCVWDFFPEKSSFEGAKSHFHRSYS
jgi:hypothetical protein